MSFANEKITSEQQEGCDPAACNKAPDAKAEGNPLLVPS